MTFNTVPSVRHACNACRQVSIKMAMLWLGITSLQELEVDQRGELRATLADDMELVIGNTQVIERVRRFAAIYSQLEFEWFVSNGSILIVG